MKVGASPAAATQYAEVCLVDPVTGEQLSSGGVVRTVSITPTVEATPDYSDGDVIGGLNTLAGLVRKDTGTGHITGVRIASKVDNTVAIDCIFLRATPSGTTVTENGAVALAATDLTKVLGVVKVDTWFDIGTGAIGFEECKVPITGLTADDVYLIMVARGTINLGSTSDLIVEVTATGL